MIAFQCTKFPSEKGSAVKLFPFIVNHKGIKFLPFTTDPFSDEREKKKKISRVAIPLKWTLDPQYITKTRLFKYIKKIHLQK